MMVLTIAMAAMMQAVGERDRRDSKIPAEGEEGTITGVEGPTLHIELASGPAVSFRWPGADPGWRFH